MDQPLWLLTAVLASAPTLMAGDRIRIESVVAFHTQCANCHEGECSGRLSFDLGPTVADAHIRRHGGALPLETVRDLAELLRYMKERCAFYPLPLALIEDRTWGVDVLRHLRAPDGTAYFLPLGRLAPGAYRLWLDMPDPGPAGRPDATAEIIAADFEPLPGLGSSWVDGRWLLQFQVDGPAEHYARLKADRPIALVRAELTPAPAGHLGPPCPNPGP